MKRVIFKGQTIFFPDDMPEEEMLSILRTKFPEPAKLRDNEPENILSSAKETVFGTQSNIFQPAQETVLGNLMKKWFPGEEENLQEYVPATNRAEMLKKWETGKGQSEPGWQGGLMGLLQGPWVDPTSVLAGAGSVALRSGLPLAGKVAQMGLGTLTGTAVEPLVGTAAEEIESKYPWLALPAGIALGIGAGKLIESPLQKIILKSIASPKPLGSSFEPPPIAPKAEEAAPLSKEFIPIGPRKAVNVLNTVQTPAERMALQEASLRQSPIGQELLAKDLAGRQKTSAEEAADFFRSPEIETTMEVIQKNPHLSLEQAQDLILQSRKDFMTWRGRYLDPLLNQEGALTLHGGKKPVEVDYAELNKLKGDYGLPEEPTVIGGAPKAGMLAYGQPTYELPKYAGGQNLNLGKYDLTYGQKKIINDVVDQFGLKKTKMSVEEVETLASMAGLDPIDFIKGYDPAKTGLPMSVWATAMNKTIAQEATRMDALKYAIAAKSTISDRDLALYARNLSRYAQLIDMAQTTTSDIGRSLRMKREIAIPDEPFYRLIGGGSGKTTPSQDKLINEIIKELGGPEATTESLKAFIKLDSSDPLYPLQLATLARQTSLLKAKRTPQGTATQRGFFAYLNGLLSMPTTHMANILGNSAATATRATLEKATEAGMDTVKSLITRNPRSVFFGEIPAEISGMVRSARDAARLGKVAYMDAHETAGAMRSLFDGVRGGLKAWEAQVPTDILMSSKLERITGNPFYGKAGDVMTRAEKVQNALAPVIGGPTRAMTLEDNIAKAINYRGVLSARAYRQAKIENAPDIAKRMAELIQNPTTSMLAAAEEEALYRTFNDTNKLASAVIAGRETWEPFKYIAPFVKTPLNIFKYAAQRTPLALITKSGRTEEGMAKIIAGSMIGAATMMMVSNDKDRLISFTGGGPKDAMERETLLRTGWTPYSLKVGDTYYSLARLEPIGSIMGIAADLKEAIDDWNPNKANENYFKLLLSITRNMTSKTFASGFVNLMDAITDPQRYGERWWNQIIGSFMPVSALTAGVARSLDPTYRTTETPLDVIQSRIPFMSEQLLPRRNIWGEEIQRPGTPTSRMVSPILGSDVKPDKANEELLRLQKKGDFTVKMPAKHIRGIELTPEEYDKMSLSSGTYARKFLDQQVNSQGWDNIPDEMKARVVQRAFSNSRRMAAMEVLMGMNPTRRLQGMIENRMVLKSHEPRPDLREEASPY